MKALKIERFGDLTSLALTDVEAPICQDNELLVDVHAVGLNRADLLQCLGRYPAPPGFPPNIPGLEYAGVISAVGKNVTRFKVGESVMGLVGGGAFSAQVCVQEYEALRVPSQLSLTEAAAVPEAFLTAFDAMVLQGELQKGQSVLVHAVASGVGLAAMQIAQAWGCPVIGTTRSSDKLNALPLGNRDVAIVCSGASLEFAKQVLDATSQKGVELVIDLVGGPYVAESIRCMAPQGRLILVGLLAGASAELPLSEILRKRLRVQGTVLRSRSAEEKARLAQSFHDTLLPLFESRALQPQIDEVFPLEHFAAAFSKMANNQTVGKLVLQWSKT